MTNTAFAAQVRSQPGCATIDLTGEMNAFAEGMLTQAFSQAEQTSPELIVLNFREVSYINSTGIALIVGLLSRARKSKRKLAVFGLSEHYLKIFQITRLSDFMSIYPDEASALQSLQ